MPDSPTHSDFGRLAEQQNLLDRRHDELRAGIESIKQDAHRRLDAQASAVRANVIAVQGVGKRLDVIEAEVKRHGEGLTVNTALTQTVVQNTQTIVDLFGNARGFFKTAGWIGTAITRIAVPAGVLFGAYKAVTAWLHS